SRTMSSMTSPEVDVQGVELRAPEALVRMHPAGDLAQRRRVQPVEDLPALPLAADEPGLLQDLQVLRNGWQRDLEILGQLHDGLVLPGQGVQEPPARGVGYGPEHCVHGDTIFKRLLKCQDPRAPAVEKNPGRRCWGGSAPGWVVP